MQHTKTNNHIIPNLYTMRKQLLIIAFALTTGFLQAQVINIPDANFNTALLNYIPKIDLNNNGKIELSEAQAITTLSVISKSISDLRGIEYFTKLSKLYCKGNNLQTLDLSQNTALTLLDCSSNSNGLRYLDVSKNIALTELNCSKNAFLNTLNFGSANKLQNLNCSGCNFTSLNVSSLVDLVQLRCSSNFLTVLETNGAVSLDNLSAESNRLSNIDLSSNTKITSLYLSVNQFTNLDISKLTKLVYFWINSNSILSLDLSNNISLKQLNCSYNNLSSLDTKNNMNLGVVDCNNNKFTSLDLGASIYSLNCSSNNLTDFLDLTKTGVFILDCTSNPNLKSICLPNLGPNTTTSYMKDAIANWSTSCGTITSIEDGHIELTPKTLVKILTPLGQEIQPERAIDGLFIYQYSDGSTRKIAK